MLSERPFRILRTLGAVPSRQIQPDGIYVVRDGPFQCGVVHIISVESTERVHAIVEGRTWLTPRVTLHSTKLKRLPAPIWGLPWWDKAIILAAFSAAFYYALTFSAASIIACLCALPLFLFRWSQAAFRSRRLKTCPNCRQRLDYVTYWSRCLSCEWKRPMPALGNALSSNTAAENEDGP